MELVDPEVKPGDEVDDGDVAWPPVDVRLLIGPIVVDTLLDVDFALLCDALELVMPTGDEELGVTCETMLDGVAVGVAEATTDVAFAVLDSTAVELAATLLEVTLLAARTSTASWTRPLETKSTAY